MEKSKKSSERHVFLLSDMIVLCKKKSDKSFTFKQQIILKNTKCVDIPDKGIYVSHIAHSQSINFASKSLEAWEKLFLLLLVNKKKNLG